MLARLRSEDIVESAPRTEASDAALLDEWRASGVRFVSSSERQQSRYDQAVRELLSCIRPAGTSGPILHEGGIYAGCWLESTGTISAELLSRFLPSVAERTFLAFADSQRDDGLFPYKLTDDGPVFSQIQLVSPPARSVWTHYRLHGNDHVFLERMYGALARYDDWLARWRNTRQTGAVEAFCAYDTGHDLSPRFWHVPDSPHRNDPVRHDPANPILPFIAPDLTAAVACGREYLAAMAADLGESDSDWHKKAFASEKALFRQCWDDEDGFFYDRDSEDRFVRVQSDVLLRVVAAEIGSREFFDGILERYLLNTRKFFAKYPFTSIALDDPRYDPGYDYNSWAGPSNFLSLIRAPHAFEHHGRHVELTWAIQPTLAALFRGTRFPQTLHPHTGREGFTEAYSPAILCMLDFVERLCGIMPRTDGTLWFTCLTPAQIEHRDQVHETGYARTVDGRAFELVNTEKGSIAYRDGKVLFEAPRGVRVITDRRGELHGLIGMVAHGVDGVLRFGNTRIEFNAAANERLCLEEGRLVSVDAPGLVPPTY